MPGSTLTNLLMNLVVLAAIMSNLACYRWGNRGRRGTATCPGSYYIWPRNRAWSKGCELDQREESIWGLVWVGGCLEPLHTVGRAISRGVLPSPAVWNRNS